MRFQVLARHDTPEIWLVTCEVLKQPGKSDWELLRDSARVPERDAAVEPLPDVGRLPHVLQQPDADHSAAIQSVHEFRLGPSGIANHN